MNTEQKLIFDEVTKGLDPSLVELWKIVADQCTSFENFNKWIEHIKIERQNNG